MRYSAPTFVLKQTHLACVPGLSQLLLTHGVFPRLAVRLQVSGTARKDSWPGGVDYLVDWRAPPELASSPVPLAVF